MLFRVGRVHISTAVLESTVTANDLVTAFSQYISGDWGETSASEDIQNDAAIAFGERIVARYAATDGSEFYITTHDGSTQIVFEYEMETVNA